MRPATSAIASDLGFGGTNFEFMSRQHMFVPKTFLNFVVDLVSLCQNECKLQYQHCQLWVSDYSIRMKAPRNPARMYQDEYIWLTRHFYPSS
jgi:hypothetical protein